VAVWKNTSATLRKIAHEKLTRAVFNSDDFIHALDDLPDDLVNSDAYRKAARLGAEAVGLEVTIDHAHIARQNATRVQRYADRVPARIAGSLAKFLNEEQGPQTSLDAIYESLNAKLEALGSDVERYAEPPWSSGNESYGSQLHDYDVLVDWVLDDSVVNCDDCSALESEGPYDSDTIPTWPKQGDTVCLDRCYCSIVANEASWAEHFPNAA